MLVQAYVAGNLRTVLTAVFLVFLPLILIGGCATPAHSLEIWQQSAASEDVVRFRSARGDHPDEWFVRVLDSQSLPKGCVYLLSDKFRFVRITDRHQWQQLARCTSGLSNEEAPDFRSGLVVGLMAQVGLPHAGRWPIHVDLIRRRAGIGFAMASFHPGFYRPLFVPPYLHLVYIKDVKALLGVQVNHQLFGFNVPIEKLTEAIREPSPSSKAASKAR